MSVFVHFRPHLMSQLLAYQEAITQIASTYFLQYWLAYDGAFRQKRANNPFLRWDVEDTPLYIAYLRASPTLASASLPVSSASSSVSRPAQASGSGQSNSGCFNCGKFGHFAKACPYATRVPPSGPPRPKPSPSPSSGQAPSVPAAPATLSPFVPPSGQPRAAAFVSHGTMPRSAPQTVAGTTGVPTAISCTQGLSAGTTPQPALRTPLTPSPCALFPP
jgi:hypothetical protein